MSCFGFFRKDNAAKFGVPVMDEEQFLEIIGGEEQLTMDNRPFYA
jgi:hypothetical protein